MSKCPMGYEEWFAEYGDDDVAEFCAEELYQIFKQRLLDEVYVVQYVQAHLPLIDRTAEDKPDAIR